MSHAPRFCGVILAAGASTRMGEDKALLAWQGGTFLSRAIDSLAAVTELVVVVGGVNAVFLKQTVDGKAAFLVVNTEPEKGQFSSLQRGLREVLLKGCDSAVVTLVDRPAVHARTLLKLVRAFREAATQGKWAVVPEVDGRHGHPIVIGRSLIEAFLDAPVTSTAREVEHANQERILYVPVDDPLAVANVDTPEQYQALLDSAKPTSPQDTA